MTYRQLNKPVRDVALLLLDQERSCLRLKKCWHKFGGVIQSKGLRGPAVLTFTNHSTLKPATSLMLKKPSPLSVPPLCRSPPLHSSTGKLGSPHNDQSQSPAGPMLIQRWLSFTHLCPQLLK